MSKGRGSSAEGACAFPWAPCLYAPSSCKTPTGKRGEGVCPIPTHSRPLFSHSISFCHCSFSAPWWAHSEGHPPRQPPSRAACTLFLSLAFRRLAVFFPRAARLGRISRVTRTSGDSDVRERDNSDAASISFAKPTVISLSNDVPFNLTMTL